MKVGNTLLYTGLFISILIHGLVFTLFSTMNQIKEPVKIKKISLLVPVTVSEPEKKQIPKPVPEKKKPPVKKVKKRIAAKKKTVPAPLPVSHKRTLDEPQPKAEEVKPVFGVSKKTVTHADTTKMAVRVGNTLMKEQEEAFTPPAEVKDYVTVPVFDLTTLPEFKNKIAPDYPETLKNDEIEGEVALSVIIDKTGKVAHVEILHATHTLFAKAAVDAVKKSLFKPATKNGLPVATVLDDLVYTFLLSQ